MLVDIGLPAIGVRLVVQPEAHVEQNACRQQGNEALAQFPRRAADGNRVGGHCPGGNPGGERPGPADVQVTVGFAPVGLAQEGEHGGQHQHRLQPLAQQNEKRAGEGQLGVQIACRERRLDPVQRRQQVGVQLPDIRLWPGSAQRLPVRQHARLDVQSQRRVDRLHRLLQWLKAVQIRRQRLPVGARAVTRLVAAQTFREQAPHQGQRFAAIVAQRLRRTAQIRQYGAGRWFADLIRHRTGQRRQVRERLPAAAVLPGRLACTARVGVMAQAADVKSQRPAVLFGQGCEAGHAGAAHAIADGVVEHGQALGVLTQRIVEVARRWVQGLPGRAIATAFGAMAAGALRRVDMRRRRQVGCALRGKAQLVKLGNAGLELRRQAGHLRGRCLAQNGAAQGGGLRDQPVVPRLLRQLAHQLHRAGGELQHLRELGVIRHGAIHDRATVIDADVIEQVHQPAGSLVLRQRPAQGQRQQQESQHQARKSLHRERP